MWTKLDDGFWAHPKVIEAGNEAAGAFARMLSWSARYSDGEVPGDVANIISAGNLSALEKLAEVGLIEKRKSDWFIPSYSEYNLSRAEWDEKRRKDAERQRRHREQHNGNGSRPISESALEDLLKEPAE
jgi:hypothetical protein